MTFIFMRSSVVGACSNLCMFSKMVRYASLNTRFASIIRNELRAVLFALFWMSSTIKCSCEARYAAFRLKNLYPSMPQRVGSKKSPKNLRNSERFWESALLCLMPNFSRKVEVIKTIEYELSPPEYGLCRLCLARSFFTIKTM